MKLHFLLAALALACGAARAQSEPPPAAPPAPPAQQQQQQQQQNPAVPLSAFESIQTPPALTPSPTDPATPPPPLRLRIDPNLTGSGIAPPAADDTTDDDEPAAESAPAN